MRSAVITIVAGRHDHLLAQRASLRRSHTPFDLHVVVSLGDDGVGWVLSTEQCADDLETVYVAVSADPAALPLAAGRNAGAAAAVAADAELLVFLDVDCLAATDLLDRYVDAAARRPDALLSGPVTYLSEADTADIAHRDLSALRSPHPARPDPPPGCLETGRHGLFWSLSFALTRRTWQRIDGFDEGYTGYGAEDTDFAARAREHGIDLLWVGGADAYHQHHATASPPVQHVDAILRNGARFAARWGEWPMPGWLERFADLDLVTRSGSGWQRSVELRVASVPEHHPYVTAVSPTAARSADAGRTTGWEPDPLFEPGHLRRVAGELDLVHVHFGYEHLDPAQLGRWLRVLDEVRLPLVLTVHDLRNPHLVDNSRHEAHLRLLLAAASEVITLTAGAAAEILDVHGRQATVIAHPTLLAAPPPPPPGTASAPTVLVPLGALRANVLDVEVLLAAVVAGADAVGGRVRVELRPGVTADPRARSAAELAEAGRLDLVRTDYVSEDDLIGRLADMHALVLPYRFGTHSGWIETARDVGVRPVVPSGGYYRQQWAGAETYDNDERVGLGSVTLSAAVARALARPRPAPAERGERLAERAHVRALHEVVYRRAVSA